MIKTRQQLQNEEEKFLEKYALKSKDSIGRVHKHKPDNFRLPFQRDRDRIIHSRPFRRLQAKTQVFVSYFGDHYRDRLTHSIEVSQIARDLSRRLGLNEDLSECIALAHDLGHTPFGHGGEDALNEAMKAHGLHFEHNEQSRRILEELERVYPNFNGLNLTKEVLDGLLKHKSESKNTQKTFIKFMVSPHLETQAADIADEIAYINHDLDDGLRSGIITVDQIKDFTLWKKAAERVKEEYGNNEFGITEEGRKRYQSRVNSDMMSQMLHDVQETSEENIQKNHIDSIKKVRLHNEKIISFSKDMKPQIEQLREFLLNNFYINEKVDKQIKRGKRIILELFEFYKKNPDKMPEPFISLIKSGEQVPIVVKDYIAGMTDHYAEEKHNQNL